MNIIYTCDNNFVWIMGISMISLFENNMTNHNLHVYLLGDNISTENKSILDNIAKTYNRKFTLIDVPDLNIPSILTSKRWPKSAFTRMFSGDLMPKECKRALYLDCDTIVKGSLEDLESYNMEDYAIFGVKDCVSSLYKQKIGIKDTNCYINAGVLLMNLEKMRSLNIREMMSNFIKEYASNINYADQDILNGMFSGNFGVLQPNYDVMTLTCAYTYKQICQIRKPSYYYSKEEIEFSNKYPIIVHYTTCMNNIRPWHKNSNHPYAADFDYYMQKSPWKDKEKGIANFNGIDQIILKLVLALPNNISFRVIGFIHGVIRPFIIKLKGK